MPEVRSKDRIAVLATIEIDYATKSRAELFYANGDIYWRNTKTGEVRATDTGATEGTARQVIQQCWGQPCWRLQWGEPWRCRIYGTHPDASNYPMGSKNDYLFGDMGGDEDGYSREFPSREEAERGITKLLLYGDYGDVRPEFVICEA